MQLMHKTLALLLGISLLTLTIPAQSNALAGTTIQNCGSVKGYNRIHFSGYYNSPIDTAPYYASQKSGYRNSCVKDIQKSLNATFCTASTQLVVDGSYGAKTATAVSRFQKLFRDRGFMVNNRTVSVDGTVGPQTWSLVSTQKLSIGTSRFSCQ